MKRNVAGQTVSAGVINASTGAAFTGTVTVYVKVDGNAQALGSVGAGVCTHDGNGQHTYAPSADETNGAHLRFMFVGTGAVNALVEVWTGFPQSQDHASALAAIIAAIASLPGASTIAASVGALVITPGGQTVKGILARLAYSNWGKRVGQNGPTHTAYNDDGTGATVAYTQAVNVDGSTADDATGLTGDI